MQKDNSQDFYMLKLTITDTSEDNLSQTLRKIADEVESGNTWGFDRYFSKDDEWDQPFIACGDYEYKLKNKFVTHDDLENKELESLFN